MNFLEHLHSKQLKKDLNELKIDQNIIDNLINDFIVNYKHLHIEEIDDYKSVIQSLYLSYKCGLSVRQDLGYAYLQITKEKQQDRWIKILQFQPMYKGLLYKARENGYDIDCDYVLHSEHQHFKYDLNTNKIDINTNNRFLLPTPTIPRFDYLKYDNLKEQITNHKWEDSHIVGFFVIIKDIKTNQTIKISRYSLLELMERCVEIKKDFTTKIETKTIKNKFISDFLNKKEMMLTNVIEALKIRAIRLVCKTLNEDLSEITTLIDKSDGYLPVVKENFTTVNISEIKNKIFNSRSLDELKEHFNDFVKIKSQLSKTEIDEVLLLKDQIKQRLTN